MVRELIERHLTWLSTSPVPRLADLIGEATPVDIDAYEQTLRLCGFVLPPSLRELITDRGHFFYPDFYLPLERFARSNCGFQLCDEASLFDNYIHALTEASAGVAQGGAFLVFATVRHDLEPAIAFDRRFRRDDEYHVGTYHQDIVCTDPLGDDEPLWDGERTFTAWFERFFTDVQKAIEEADHGELSKAIDQRLALRERSSATSRPPTSWRQRWEAIGRGEHSWGNYGWASWREVLQQTDDLTIVEKIAAEVQADLDERPGRGIVPGLSSGRARGSWAYGLPGPFDLAARLPERGHWGRYDLCRWALSHAEVALTTEATNNAWSVLEALAGEQDVSSEERRAALLACADEGWQKWRPDETTREHRFARALAWAISSVEIPRVRHVFAEAHALRSEKEDDLALSAEKLWRRLLEVVLKGAESVSDELYVKRQTESADAKALEAWLSAIEGSQREILQRFEQDWLGRLQGAPADARAEAVRMLRKKIKSKKLVAARDALINQLTTA